MKKDVMLIVNYWHFESEKASSRYRSMADILCKKYDLEVVTSTFCHLKKSQRNADELDIDSLPYKMTLQYEKGYKKNISVQRILSYTQFGKNVYQYLLKRKKPDLIIVSVPSLSVAEYVTKYANKNNIPVIVDIQDLWPEAFKMAIDIPVISDFLFFPMKKQAEKIYKSADTIMAVSDTYARFGGQFNTSGNFSIYIGTDSKLVTEESEKFDVIKPANEFWIGYIGALGHSYDIKLVISALNELKQKGYTNIVFKVMGDGILKEDFEKFALDNNVVCDFTGLLNYGLMMKTLMNCDIAVNPIVGKSVSSIINKVSDYAAANVPVINTQKSEEYRNLISQYNAGINVENGNAHALADAIDTLYTDSTLREEMKKGQQQLFCEKFDRANTYNKIIDIIENQLT